MSLPTGHPTVCASCAMFTIFAQPREDEFHCMRCKLVASLEARIKDLEEQLANARAITSLEADIEKVHSEVVGTGRRGDHQAQVEESDSWEKVRRRGRGKSAREPSPELVHRNKYARLQNAEETSPEMVPPEQSISPSSQENNCEGMEVSRGDVPKRQLLVVGDSIIRRVQGAICHKDNKCRTVCCLPGARVRHIVDRVDRLLGGAGKDPAVMVHVGTNDRIKGRWSVLKSDYKSLGNKLKARTSRVVFSEILPVPRATQERQRELRELNLWLKEWCKKEGFGFLENWADFSGGYQLYSRDGLHLNGAGAARLGKKMASKVEELLN